MKGVMKLLIVDDEPDIFEFTKMFFESQNLKVYVALDGKQALDIIAPRARRNRLLSPAAHRPAPARPSTST